MRNQMEICLEILEICKKPINITGLLRKANLGGRQGYKFTSFLESRDLLFSRYIGRERILRNSVLGYMVLKSYNQFFKFFKGKNQKIEV